METEELTPGQRVCGTTLTQSKVVQRQGSSSHNHHTAAIRIGVPLVEILSFVCLN